MNAHTAHPEITALTDKLLRHIRNRLFLQYRYLEPAIYRLIPNECDGMPGVFGTDGSSLYYDPTAWLQRFHSDSTSEIRRYLHTLFHCIYLHPFITQNADPRFADLACDITIEAAISAQFSDFPLQSDNERIRFVKKIQQTTPLLTLPEVFKYLKNHAADSDIEQLRNLFRFDDHIWLMPSNESPNSHEDSDNPINDDSEPGSSQSNSSQSQHNTSGSDSTDAQNHNTSINASLPGSAVSSTKASEWKEAARKIMVDMESFSCRGSERGLLEKNIAWLTRDQMDYSEFLSQFAVMEEKMMIDPDEFDVIYYTYGLGLPGRKKLLIEPLEYKEIKQIREFVIAIDTSGSTSDELVQKFLNKTYSILKSTEMFTSAVNIHIIQCDAQIQEDITIHSLDDIEAYARNFKVKGLGGTDFRPVFQYVDKLRTEGAFSNLCGLIYFTDGQGIYPSRPADYKTAFVFLDKYEDCCVPAWALKAYWREDKS